MAYFVDKATRNKSYILYFITKMGTALTKPQIATAFIEMGLLGYFELMLELADLEKLGLVAAVPCVYGEGYGITPKGEEFFKMSFEQLPLSARSEIDEYIKANFQRLIGIEEFSSSILKDNDGGYTAFLNSFDKDKILLSIAINVIDVDSAQMLSKNWEAKAHLVYKAIVDILSE
ncbi:MAG: DUF4364 family protein [Clostridiales bacterium]|nr:DUF4364 family protein [Clostridiales bacterium]